MATLLTRSKRAKAPTVPVLVQLFTQALDAVGDQGLGAGLVQPVRNQLARGIHRGIGGEAADLVQRLGFGLRFSVLGLLEFIDWGGGDILYYASRYLADAIDPRFASPAVIARNMEQGRNGLRDGRGFYDYAGMDVNAYKMERLAQLCKRLEVMELLPRYDAARQPPAR